ncbi:hypothetical protein EYF80_005913 [Liparis tanakae]|uniref:Uncharacterized protein n=1 Tax=Liparis tanakae TaxID=230148 RepID=A0A4Z2J124_9TELE|nr:hypothetical protein EYF80_005913 [Liparis tanakae]
MLDTVSNKLQKVRLRLNRPGTCLRISGLYRKQISTRTLDSNDTMIITTTNTERITSAVSILWPRNSLISTFGFRHVGGFVERISPPFAYEKQLSCQSSSTLALRLAVGLCRPVMRSRGITPPRTLHSIDKEHHPLFLWKPDDAPTLWCPSGLECVKHGAHRSVPLHAQLWIISSLKDKTQSKQDPAP